MASIEISNVESYNNWDDILGTFGGNPEEPVKSVNPNKPPSSFHYLDFLPLPALQVVLLNLERSELNKLSCMNKRVKNICNLPNFQQIYNGTHKRRLFVNPKFSKVDVFRCSNGNYDENYTFLDERGTKIELGTNNKKVIWVKTMLANTFGRQSRFEPLELLFYMQGEAKKMETNLLLHSQEQKLIMRFGDCNWIDFSEVTDILKHLQRLKWVKGSRFVYKGCRFGDKNAALEFLNELKKSLIEVDPKSFNRIIRSKKFKNNKALSIREGLF